MSKALTYLFVFTLLLNLCSCEKDFVPKEQAGAQKMVVESLLDNVQNIKVYVTESASPNTSSGLNPLRDAMVELYKNGSLLQVLPYVPSDSANTFGAYQYPGLAEPGSRYAITVTQAKYGTATSTDLMPPVPVGSNGQIVYYGTSANDFQTKVHLEFQDNGAEENFYGISVFQYGLNAKVSDLGDTVFTAYASINRPQLLETVSDTVREYNTALLFSDKSFNGQNKMIDLVTKTIDLKKVYSCSLYVELIEVSRANFNYYKTLEHYQKTNNGSDGAKVFGNIQNGYGIFMSQSVYPMSFVVK